MLKLAFGLSKSPAVAVCCVRRLAEVYGLVQDIPVFDERLWGEGDCLQSMQYVIRYTYLV